MRRPEEVKLEFTQEWVRKAENDYRTAKYLVESGQDFAYGATFHAQQAAEKYIKAFLVWHQIEFRKTHDIALLLELTVSVEAEIAKILSQTIELTPYGAQYRYPGDYPEVNVADMNRAFQLAELARMEIQRRLPRQIMM